ncbi:MAG: hypothetical protein ABFC94_02510 [Syntrophomonas sp.]
MYSNGNGHDTICISGSCVLIKPVSVGEKWDINYVSISNAGTFTRIAEGQFVGTENITVMGSNLECTHVRIKGIRQGGSSSKSFTDDYWLVKGIGVVKVIYDGPDDYSVTDELIEIQ